MAYPVSSRIQIARLLIPFWAVDVLLLAVLAWQIASLARRWSMDHSIDMHAAHRAAGLGILLAIMVPSEVVLAVSDAASAFRVDALLGALLALTSVLAAGACVFALAACQRERFQARDTWIRAHAEGSNRGTRSCRAASPSRQRGIGGHVIVVMRGPGLRYGLRCHVTAVVLTGSCETTQRLNTHCSHPAHLIVQPHRDVVVFGMYQVVAEIEDSRPRHLRIVARRVLRV